MKGLELARNYYETYGKKLIDAVEPALFHRAAFGLCGEGSQCFGYDDTFSQDHDFAPGFCIWLSDADFAAYGQVLQQAYDNLPDTFLGFSTQNILATDRLGVMPISRFYQRFTGSPTGPATLLDWLMTPEAQLASATNGAIFHDEDGAFTAVRNRLLAFYPEDVLRKKIAARAAIMAQAGQYNLLRLIKRGDVVAATLALARFTEATISMVHLLNRRYTPFYKWGFYSLKTLPRLADTAAPLLAEAAKLPAHLSKSSAPQCHDLAFDLTEKLCALVASELRAQGFSQTSDNFLQSHLSDIMAGIKDPQLSAMHPMVDCPN